MLNTLTHGTATDTPPLLIVHGLYGSARNWRVIAKRLADERQVIAVDQRNHGQSPHTETHTYLNMADDLAELIATLHGPVDLVGHSMGGKAAMALALQQPALVKRLIVADIAPVTYEHDQTQFIAAMRAVDLSQVRNRSDVTTQLAKHVDDPALQSFFTQSVDITNQRWRLNLDVLERDMPHILGFPDLAGPFDGPTLFLSGADSTYVRPEHRAEIRAKFPRAKFAKIPGAGHWLHADKPREFEAALRYFLTNT